MVSVIILILFAITIFVFAITVPNEMPLICKLLFYSILCHVTINTANFSRLSGIIPEYNILK